MEFVYVFHCWRKCQSWGIPHWIDRLLRLHYVALPASELGLSVVSSLSVDAYDVVYLYHNSCFIYSLQLTHNRQITAVKPVVRLFLGLCSACLQLCLCVCAHVCMRVCVRVRVCVRPAYRRRDVFIALVTQSEVVYQYTWGSPLFTPSVGWFTHLPPRWTIVMSSHTYSVFSASCWPCQCQFVNGRRHRTVLEGAQKPPTVLTPLSYMSCYHHRNHPQSSLHSVTCHVIITETIHSPHSTQLHVMLSSLKPSTVLTPLSYMSCYHHRNHPQLHVMLSSQKPPTVLTPLGYMSCYHHRNHPQSSLHSVTCHVIITETIHSYMSCYHHRNHPQSSLHSVTCHVIITETIHSPHSTQLHVMLSSQKPSSVTCHVIITETTHSPHSTQLHVMLSSQKPSTVLTPLSYMSCYHHRNHPQSSLHSVTCHVIITETIHSPHSTQLHVMLSSQKPSTVLTPLSYMSCYHHRNHPQSSLHSVTCHVIITETIHSPHSTQLHVMLSSQKPPTVLTPLSYMSCYHHRKQKFSIPICKA